MSRRFLEDDRGGDARWRVARHLLDTHAGRPETAMADMCRELADALRGARWCYVVAGRGTAADAARPRDAMMSAWMTLHIEYDPRVSDNERRAWDRARARVRFADDPGGKQLIQQAGRPRIQLMRRFYASHSAAPMRAHLESLGVVDRVIGAVPVTADVEVWVIVDRHEGQHFDDGDAAFVEATLPVFARGAYRLCMQRGWLETSETLTPREREVLGHLLAGLSEAECAATLGLRSGSVHQVVVRIFRKLGVSSRAELMARCLGSANPELAARE